jgi:hypothetical protein
MSLCTLEPRSYIITYDTFPKSTTDLSNFKRGIPDGSSRSKAVIDLYKSFAARSRAIESMHGIYEKV